VWVYAAAGVGVLFVVTVILAAALSGGPDPTEATPSEDGASAKRDDGASWYKPASPEDHAHMHRLRRQRQWEEHLQPLSRKRDRALGNKLHLL
jgi:hypothetical protein